MAMHDDERFVSAAIESVLAQTFTDFELVIVNDASTDRSRAIAASYGDARMRIVDNDSNLGLASSLNRGLSICRGDYVARLDADDIAFPARIAKQVAWLDAHPEVAALGTQAVPIDVRGKRIRRVPWFSAQWRRPTGGLWMEWYRIFDTPLVHSGVMFRRAEVQALGGYEEQRTLGEDADLWMRIARRWQLANLDEPLVGFRLTRFSMTSDPSRPERTRYLERKVPIVQTLMRELLQWEDGSSRAAALWVSLNAHSDRFGSEDVPELESLLEECVQRFFTLHPEARAERGIASHRASMLARMIDKSDFRTMLRLYIKMFALDAHAALLVLPRVVFQRLAFS